jgi:hypothetical protein
MTSRFFYSDPVSITSAEMTAYLANNSRRGPDPFVGRLFDVFPFLARLPTWTPVFGPYKRLAQRWFAEDLAMWTRLLEDTKLQMVRLALSYTFLFGFSNGN